MMPRERTIPVEAQKRRALVVDDDPGMRHLMWMVLRDAGWTVTTASNTAEAQRRLECEPFTLLVTDHDMPRESGLDFIRRLRKGGVGTADRTIPTIMVCSSGCPDHLEAAHGAGIRAVLQKPFRPAMLSEVADRLESEGLTEFLHVRAF